MFFFRLVLYVKLFLLMGGTWLMDIISWGVGGPAWIWILPDLINCSRGIFIFYFCVWSNKKVRNSLLRRVCSKYASKFGVNDASKSYNFKTINGSEPPNFHCDSTQVTLNAKYQENDTAV